MLIWIRKEKGNVLLLKHQQDRCDLVLLWPVPDDLAGQMESTET
jgi:hypothetical protein